MSTASLTTWRIITCIGMTSAVLGSDVARAEPPASVHQPAAADEALVLPIDLPTALRLANASNPTIALARERINESYARLRQAEVLWLPNLQAGPAYQRHDGRIQNSRGEVFTIDKSNFFIGGGASLRLETVDALFGPLLARRLTEAQVAATRAVTDDVQLEVALTYLDLLRVYGALAINADTLARAEELLRRSSAADKQGLSRSKADITRAGTEASLRREERIDLEGEAAAVAARLAQLLLLEPTVDLRPADATIAPITLVSEELRLDELVATGLMNRPELAESRALVGAAMTRWRQARLNPLLPRLELTYFAGEFGGGVNDTLEHFGGRGDGTAAAVWELHNLGAGDIARARERRAQYNEANFHVLEVQARVAAEVTAAAKLARSRKRALRDAQEAVTQALETWRRLEIGSFGMNNPKEQNLLNTLEPLVAEQALAQARIQYLIQVIEYNREQFRLYKALGQPPLSALPTARPLPVDVPLVNGGVQPERRTMPDKSRARRNDQ